MEKLVKYNYDLIIIGSGPGGEGAAMKATRNGLNVAIIEDDALGGACNYWGTIPSKTLRQLSREIKYNSKTYDFPEMLDTAYEIVLKQTEIKKIDLPTMKLMYFMVLQASWITTK